MFAATSSICLKRSLWRIQSRPLGLKLSDRLFVYVQNDICLCAASSEEFFNNSIVKLRLEKNDVCVWLLTLI